MTQQLVELPRLRNVLFEEAGVIFLAYFRQHVRDRRLHVSDKTEMQRCPAAKVLRIRVNLDFFHVAVRQKLGKRKICPEKKIGAVYRVVRSAVAEETGHARGIGVVMLEPLLAAEGVSDRRF